MVMLATKTSAGATPEVNLRKHTSHILPSSANKAAFPDVQNKGISALTKDICLPKNFKKNRTSI